MILVWYPWFQIIFRFNVRGMKQIPSETNSKRIYFWRNKPSYLTQLTRHNVKLLKKRISFLIITLLTWIKYHSNTRSYSAKNKISYNHSSIISHAISTNNNMPYFNITLTSLKKIPSRLLSISWLKAHLSSFRNYIKFPANYTPPSRIQFYFDTQNNILFKQYIVSW